MLSGNQWAAVQCSVQHRRPPLPPQQDHSPILGLAEANMVTRPVQQESSCCLHFRSETLPVITHSQRKVSTLCLAACGISQCPRISRPASTVFFFLSFFSLFFSMHLYRGSQGRTPPAKGLCPGWKGCWECVRSLGEGESCQAVKNGISVGWPEIGL